MARPSFVSIHNLRSVQSSYNISLLPEPKSRLPIRCSHSQAKKNDSQVLYFAYGANMCSSVLERRNVCYRKISNATIHDMYLDFNHQGAYGNVMPIGSTQTLASKPMIVHGVLYELSKDHLQKLKRFEIGYELKEATVCTYSGDPFRAKVFMTKPLMRLRQGMPPSKRYLDLIIQGAIEHDLNESYIHWVKSHPTFPQFSSGSYLPAEYFATVNSKLVKLLFSALAVVGSVIYLQST